MSAFRLVSRRCPVASVALVVLWFSVMASRCQSPAFTGIRANPDGTVQLELQTIPGQSYTFETSTNLADWAARACFNYVETNLITWLDSPPAENPGCLFYRARLGTAILYHFSFVHSAYGGSWGWIQPAYPAAIGGYAARVSVANDTNYPAATNVLFTGPGGSGLTNSPAASVLPPGSTSDTNRTVYESQVPAGVSLAPGGLWTINYKGTNQTFSVPNPQANSRLVIPYPTVSFLTNGDVKLDWVYTDPVTGAVFGEPPAFMIQIQAAFYTYASPFLAPSTTTWTMSVGGYPREANVYMTYTDSLGNDYEILFSQLPP